MDSQIVPDYDQLLARYAAAGQEQVFAFWPRLNAGERAHLLAQAAEIDLAEMRRLTDALLASEQPAVDLAGLSPAPYLARPEHGGDEARWREAQEAGEDLLRAGRVATFTVAGGQGTRLGYDGPKGTFPVTPVNNKPLFQVFAEKIRAASRRYCTTIPWFVMTSHANHEATVDFFRRHDWFGLSQADIFFFMQGRMTAVDRRGKILLETPSSLALSPDGHGGSLRAMVRSGAVAEMERRGIDTISYFQVDNPLVRCIDPAFLGFHRLSGGEMSSKTIPKAYAREKLGHFCLQNGRLVVVEYSDMPDSLTDLREPGGQLIYRAGSIAIHILGRDFVARTGGGDPAYALPFHKADKKIRTVDGDGQPVSPAKPNGVKFEMFVFDAIPFARRPVVVETLREDDFSPVKNAEGVDSPKTCREDQLRQWTRWLKSAGSEVTVDATGLPPWPIEVSPLFATDAESFAAAWSRHPARPAVGPGLYLE